MRYVLMFGVDLSGLMWVFTVLSRDLGIKWVLLKVGIPSKWGVD